MGKTPSARHYARWDEFSPETISHLSPEQLESLASDATAFFAAPVGPRRAPSMRASPAAAWVENFGVGAAALRRNGVTLPRMGDEILTAIVRVTYGNFRLLNRLLTQMKHIMEINALSEVTPTVVEVARESLLKGRG